MLVYQLGRIAVVVGLVTAGCGLVVDSAGPAGDAGTGATRVHQPSDGAAPADAASDAASENTASHDAAGDVAGEDTAIPDAAGDASLDAAFDATAGDGAAGDAGTGWLETYDPDHALGAGSLVLDAGASVLLGGGFSGSIDFGGGTLTAKASGINDNFSPTDAFLVMLEDDGTFRWQLRLAGTLGSDGVDAVALDPQGDAVAAGHFIGSIGIDGTSYDNPLPPGPQSGPGPGGTGAFLIKRSGATGSAIWSRGLTTPDGSVDPAYVTVAPDGTVVVSGTYEGTFDPGGGALGCSSSNTAPRFMAAYRGSDGAYLWSRCFDSKWSLGYIPSFDSAGDLLFVASLDGESVDFGAGPVTATATALVVAKYDGATGALLYARKVASSSAGQVAAFASSLLDGSDLAIAGTVWNSADFGSSTLTAAGGTDVFVARVAGSDGSIVWSRLFGGANTDSPTAVTVAGNAIRVGGSFQGSTVVGTQQLAGPHAYSECAFLATLSPAGDITGASYLGPAGPRAVASLAAAPDGDLFLGGTVQGELDLSSGTVLTGTNQNSLYAARLAP